MLRFIKSYLQGREQHIDRPEQKCSSGSGTGRAFLFRFRFRYRNRNRNSGRSMEQQVVVKGAVSEKLPVRSGVPQGSILGPLLFVLFINDIFSCISKGTMIALYVDDTKIWREINSYEDHFVLQSDINSLYAWSIENRMTFHPSKCKVLSVTMQRNILDNLPFNVYWYHLNTNIIEYATEHTDLGVILTLKLLFAEHCNNLVSKARSKLGLIRTCHFTTNKRQKRAFYLAVIRSISNTVQ